MLKAAFAHRAGAISCVKGVSGATGVGRLSTASGLAAQGDGGVPPPPHRGLHGGGDARRREDDFRAAHRGRAARRRHGRRGHGRGAHRAPEDPVGGRGGTGRHPAGRLVPQRGHPLLDRLPRRRGHVRAGGHRASSAPPPHDDPPHAGDPRRDPPRRRLPLVGRRRAGRLRARRTPPHADRDALPVRRQPHPLRDVREGL
jgi:hypothetical protein